MVKNGSTKETNSWGASMPAWIASIVSVLALLSTIWLQYASRRDQMDRDLTEHRRTALFHALQVIDCVYSNEPFSGPPSHPQPCDLQAARDADSQMRIYCRYPETVQFFYKALGMHNTEVQKAPGVSVEKLEQFRVQVAKELDLSSPVYSDPNQVWISNLDGAPPAQPSNSSKN